MKEYELKLSQKELLRIYSALSADTDKRMATFPNEYADEIVLNNYLVSAFGQLLYGAKCNGELDD